ncbi:hypothetical protein L2E82_50074 [Cichorium intybus]|nr:hypothetical protein L2E82_52173 [Cichorium intybus]KAI3682211.1 hypothetical protein L2E82_50074 [Cichorium intybus]
MMYMDSSNTHTHASNLQNPKLTLLLSCSSRRSTPFHPTKSHLQLDPHSCYLIHPPNVWFLAPAIRFLPSPTIAPLVIAPSVRFQFTSPSGSGKRWGSLDLLILGVRSSMKSGDVTSSML